jgi:hypothetical protein
MLTKAVASYKAMEREPRFALALNDGARSATLVLGADAEHHARGFAEANAPKLSLLSASFQTRKDGGIQEYNRPP